MPMATARDLFIKVQTRLLDTRFEFAPEEHEARQQFERLTLATYDHLSAAGFPVGHQFALTSNLSNSDRLSAALREQWKNWVNEYTELLERNPRLELRDMLHLIGESHMQNSWPYGFEQRIQQWVDHGDLTEIPFIDGHRIVTAEFFDRLRTLRKRCGGWIFFDQKSLQIVFVSEPEWQDLCATQDPRLTGRPHNPNP
jgi:hypothetical protein